MEKNNNKLLWKAGNMVYPLPAVMVTAGSYEGESNIITVAWTGTICTNPAMVYISVRPERYSYNLLKDTKEFVINLTTKQLAKATDYCGVVSGRDVDKWERANLTKGKATKVSCPVIVESPVNIECRVTEIKELGSHHMFIAEVLAIQVSEEYMDKNNRFNLSKANPIAYSHGEYYTCGELLGTFGYSVKKKKAKSKTKKPRRK